MSQIEECVQFLKNGWKKEVEEYKRSTNLMVGHDKREEISVYLHKEASKRWNTHVVRVSEKIFDESFLE